MQHKKQPTLTGNLDDFAICTSTTKTFKQIFSSCIDTFIWWCVECSTCVLHINRPKRKNNIKKKSASLSRKIVLTSEYYYICVSVPLFIFLHRFITWELSMTGFNFSVKILLAKITFLFLILSCYLLNMSLFCIDIFCHCFVVLLFCCSSNVPMFYGIPIVLWYSDCPTKVLVLYKCSSVPSMFQCSVFHQCFGIPGFIVCLPFLKKLKALLALFRQIRSLALAVSQWKYWNIWKKTTLNY